MAVTIRLADDIDISRGDMICRVHNRPHPGQDVDATVCWLTEARRCALGAKYTIKHTTRSAKALVKDLQYRLDVNTLHRDRPPTRWRLNEIGARPAAHPAPLFFDEYRRNRSHRQLHPHRRGHQRHGRAGMILGPTPERSAARTSPGTRRRCRGGAALAGGDGVAHRAVGVGEVDRRGRAGAEAGGRRAGRPTCSTATTSATGSTATSASAPRTGRERAPGRPRRPPARRCRRRRPGAADQPLPGRPGRGPGAPRRGRAAVRRGLRRHPHRAVRGADPKGSTPRPGPARSPASPASTIPTRRRAPPSSCCAPTTATPRDGGGGHRPAGPPADRV